MSVDDFMVPIVPQWGTEIEIERRNRIRLSVAAYAYEFGNHLTMDDSSFDELAKKIRPEIFTSSDITDPAQKQRYEILDEFFRCHFAEYTGQWIHKHPELDILEQYYYKMMLRRAI